MRINKFISASLSAVMLCLLSGCGSEKDMSPKPVEASDPNAVTFDDGDCSFVKIICDDDYSSDGVLSVENVKGNNMLKFTDSFIHDYDKQVQKLCISAVVLLESEGPAGLAAAAVQLLPIRKNGTILLNSAAENIPMISLRLFTFSLSFSLLQAVRNGQTTWMTLIF